MLKSAIIIIYGVCLLLQIDAVPRMRRAAGEVSIEKKQTNVLTKGADASSSEESGLNRSRQLVMTTTLVDLVGFAKYVTVNGRPLLKKALDQLEALPEKSASLQANISRIADFIKTNVDNTNVVEEEGIMALFESMITLTDILQDVNDMPFELEQTKIIQQAFTNNGSEKFEEDLMAELKVVSRKFEKAIERYLATLNEEQKAKETKLIDWYTKFTNENNDEKKAEYYTKFFDTFKP